MNKNKVMETARRAIEKGQVDKAIKEYLKIVREDPDDVRVWLKIGDLFARKGAKADATETYLKVATFYIDQGFYRKAVAVYKQILKLDPGMVEINLKLAELYRQLGLLSDAMQHFEMVAAFFHREGKTTEALATIRQLVELDPDNVATRIKLAELYSKEQMVEDAVQEFERACDFLREHNRMDDFTKVAERLLWHRPDNTVLARELASVYLKRRDPRRALQKLQACFKADPRDVQTLELLAEAFQALEQRGKTVSVLRELAHVYDELGKRSEAQAIHRRILNIAPDDEEAREYLGMTSPKMRAQEPPPDVFTSPPEIVRQPTGSIPLSSPTGSVPLVNTPPPVLDEADVEELELGEEDLELIEEIGDEPGDVPAPSEEISKMLAEVDVYVKYGLHQKAVDHIRAILEIDGSQVDARLRLVDVYLAQEREADAINELLALAQAVAPTNPDMAQQCLSRALGVDAGCEQVFAVSEQLGIEIATGVSSQEIVLSSEDSGIELDMGADVGEYELSLEDAPTEAPQSLPPEEFGEVSESGPVVDPESLTFSEQPVDDLPFDPEAAKAFDAEPGLDSPAPILGQDAPFDPDAAKTFDAELPRQQTTPEGAVAESEEAFGDEFEEAEFFAAQGLHEEAREVLEGLLAEYPNHPKILAKLREVESSVEPLDESEPHLPPPAAGSPAVLLENPIDDDDADTHYDLGVAYREMGILGEALKAFEKVVHVKGREVQCHLMIGLCHRDQGDVPEAINSFKAGLYVQSIGEAEQFSLYYEIGASYEQLGDPEEALYYFEMVHKKDPEYRDVAKRILGLQQAGNGGGGDNSPEQSL